MGSSSENRNKEHVYTLHNVAAGGFFSVFLFLMIFLLILYFH